LSQVTPIYQSLNCTAAFQLNWSVALFGRADFPLISDWLDRLKVATERDGVRILEAHQSQSNAIQFFVSTRPDLAPSDIVRSVKGRWQYLIQSLNPSIFRRNYFIGSVGDADSETLDQYVARQVQKHPMVDDRVTEQLEVLQFHDAAIEPAAEQIGNYGKYVYGLHVVVENAGHWNEVREDVLVGMREMIVRACSVKGWRLARIGLLSNHMHVLLGCHVTESPESIALSLLNNLAYVQGMKPVFRFSYYVGTFGPYNRGAIWNRIDDGAKE
jgi:REP element-mobilizing transposase RayT